MLPKLRSQEGRIHNPRGLLPRGADQYHQLQVRNGRVSEKDQNLWGDELLRQGHSWIINTRDSEEQGYCH